MMKAFGQVRCHFLFFPQDKHRANRASFVAGDAMLADALYRNFFVMDYQPGTAVKLEKMVAYIRREMSKLDDLTDEDVGRAKVRWGPPPSPPPTPTART